MKRHVARTSVFMVTALVLGFAGFAGGSTSEQATSRVINSLSPVASFTDDQGESVKLELGKSLNIPRVNGKPVNLYPEKVFDSPNLSSEHGSGVVSIQKGGKKVVLDFNESR